MKDEVVQQPQRRSRRESRRSSVFNDYVSDVDGEIMAIEAMPPVITQECHQPKKRGRPRKYPPGDNDGVGRNALMKRPRGRPRGSGKHQRAAALGESSMNTTTGENSAATSGLASGIPSTVHGIPAPSTTSQRKDKHIAVGTTSMTPMSYNAEPVEMMRGTTSECWTGQSHGGPIDVVSMTPQGSHIKDEAMGNILPSLKEEEIYKTSPSVQGRPCVLGMDDSTGVSAETPTPGSYRNRRKGRPRKTE